MPIVHRVATFNKYSDAGPLFYAVLFKVSSDYPPVNGRLHTRYAPVRRSPSTGIATRYAAPRLACVRPAASVYPEPGSNSPLSNPSPDSLLKSTSPLLYTPLPIFFLRYYRSAIGSGYLIFSKNSLAHDRNPSLFIPSLSPGSLSVCGGKGNPFFLLYPNFFQGFFEKIFQDFRAAPSLFAVCGTRSFSGEAGLQRYGKATGKSKRFPEKISHSTRTRGIASISRWVYEDCGFLYTTSVRPYSTIRPPCITAKWSDIYCTTLKS